MIDKYCFLLFVLRSIMIDAYFLCCKWILSCFKLLTCMSMIFYCSDTFLFVEYRSVDCVDCWCSDALSESRLEWRLLDCKDTFSLLIFGLWNKLCSWRLPRCCHSVLKICCVFCDVCWEYDWWSLEVMEFVSLVEFIHKRFIDSFLQSYW